LAVALPFLENAKNAAKSIQAKDITELKGSRNPTDIMKVIIDTVHLLFQRSLDPVKFREVTCLKVQTPFVFDSYESFGKATLSSATFLKDLLDFSDKEKDNINEETIELLEPYLVLKTLPDKDGLQKDIFKKETAEIASKALGGMCVWAAAMSDYHKQSKIVKPKLKLLEIKKAELEEAEAALEAAQTELKAVIELKEDLTMKFNMQNKEKMDLEESAAKTRKKMDQANRLITSLEDNKVRWI
jgi:dynein heavy chain